MLSGKQLSPLQALEQAQMSSGRPGRRPRAEKRLLLRVGGENPGMAECSGTVTKTVSVGQAVCTQQQLQNKQIHPNILVNLQKLRPTHETHPSLHPSRFSDDQPDVVERSSGLLRWTLLALPVTSLLWKGGRVFTPLGKSACELVPKF